MMAPIRMLKIAHSFDIGKVNALHRLVIVFVGAPFFLARIRFSVVVVVFCFFIVSGCQMISATHKRI